MILVGAGLVGVYFYFNSKNRDVLSNDANNFRRNPGSGQQKLHDALKTNYPVYYDMNELGNLCQQGVSWACKKWTTIYDFNTPSHAPLY